MDGGLNTYGYAVQNPVNFIDPDGLAGKEIFLPSPLKILELLTHSSPVGEGSDITPLNCPNASAEDFLRSLGRQVDDNPLEGKPGAGRQGDFFVDGRLTELKTLDPGASSATIRNTVNDSLRGTGQARDILIDARGSGLSRAEAQRGINRALGIGRGKLDRVTVIGNDFFIGEGQ